MSESNQNDEAAFDPAAMMKGMRDANMDAWAKMMTQFVNTEAYSGASAEMLNAWLATSKPFREMLETSVTQTLKGMNIATADDVVRMSERLTHIEIRLDDIEAKLDETLKKT